MNSQLHNKMIDRQFVSYFDVDRLVRTMRTILKNVPVPTMSFVNFYDVFPILQPFSVVSSYQRMFP